MCGFLSMPKLAVIQCNRTNCVAFSFPKLMGEGQAVSGLRQYNSLTRWVGVWMPTSCVRVLGLECQQHLQCQLSLLSLSWEAEADGILLGTQPPI